LIPIDIAKKDILDEKTLDIIDELVDLKNQYYENNNKDEDMIKTKEKEIYKTILTDKIKSIRKQIGKIEQTKNSNSQDTSLFGRPEFGKEYNTDNLDIKKLDKAIDEYKSQIEILTKQL